MMRIMADYTLKLNYNDRRQQPAFIYWGVFFHVAHLQSYLENFSSLAKNHFLMPGCQSLSLPHVRPTTKTHTYT